MRRIVVAVAILLNIVSSSVQASNNIIACEKIDKIHWIHIYKQKVCIMQQGTTIDSDDSIIQQTDSSISALWINSGKNIWFLPVRVAETYPNLIGYAANSCSVTKISKKNFEGLEKVKALWLTSNQIEKIPSDTFDDLISLEFVDLDQNKIKFMSGELFSHLSNLEKVYLSENECINKNFETLESINRLAEVVTELCGSYDSEEVYEESIAPAELRAIIPQQASDELRARLAPVPAKPAVQVTKEDFDKLITTQLMHQSYIQTLIERATLQEARITSLESKAEYYEAIVRNLYKGQSEIIP